VLRAVVSLYHRHPGVQVATASWPADDLVRADEGQLRQVLSNLIKNALEAMGEHGKLTLRAAREQHMLSLEIEDDGSGLPPEIDRIFDADFTTKSSGSGLGLAICRRIVEEHGGVLSARPAPRRGAIFRLSLPLAGAESPP
jgi:signal transduction histidine kinase